MIPEPFLRYAVTGPYDERYLELHLIRLQKREAMEVEYNLMLEIYNESDRRLELLQNLYSPTPVLKDIIDRALEEKR